MSPLAELCASCARCCSGAIFAATTLEPVEQQRFGPGPLPQPCPHLRGTRCGVYDVRPKACAEYLCETARRLERGEIELSEAIEAVHGAGESSGCG